MKKVFPIIISKGDNFGYVVYVPDLKINTQGETLEDAMEMARDAIGLWGICEIEAGKEIPKIKTVTPQCENGDIVTLVDVDFEVYKKMNDNKAVRKNVTIPSWLNYLSEKEHVNFSQVLQNALMQQLDIERP